MLDDQTFTKMPIIAVSHELFVSAKDVRTLDWCVIDTFRKRLSLGIFKFLFADFTMHRETYTLLCDMGVVFTGVQMLLQGNRPSEEVMMTALNLTDFVYGPELCRYLNVPNDKQIMATRAACVEALASFSEYGTPYTPSNFRLHLRG